MNADLVIWITPLTVSIIGWFLSRTLVRIEGDLRAINESLGKHAVRLAVVEATKMPADQACFSCEKRSPGMGRRSSDNAKVAIE